MCNSNTRGDIPNGWIILDNQIAVNTFNENQLLTNINTTGKRMKFECLPGITKTNMIGKIKGSKVNK